MPMGLAPYHFPGDPATCSLMAVEARPGKVVAVTRMVVELIAS
jgi:hypothetical protein